MVSRWACAVNGDRCVIVTVIFDDCRSVTVGANAKGSVFVWRLRGLNLQGFPYSDGFIVDSGDNDWMSRQNA
jgi:hypothetical protein